uniref:Uncharacterized protein n=1 Tax=Glossina palpalis gambiensis TaxID=67801 RepID=A0A1B0AXK1_9MUSC
MFSLETIVIVHQEVFDSTCSCQIFSDISTATAVSQSHSHALSMNDDANDRREEVLNHTIGRDKCCNKLKAKPTRGGVLIGVHLANSASKRKASQRRPILSITKIRGTRLSSQPSTSLNHCEQEGSWRRPVRDRATVALTQAGCIKFSN